MILFSDYNLSYINSCILGLLLDFIDNKIILIKHGTQADFLTEALKILFQVSKAKYK